MKHLIQLTVNGESHDVVVRAGRTLLDVLRDDLGLTGAKRGCDLGSCGACTVLLGGRPVNACLVLALEAEGEAIQTIESVASASSLHAVQAAFVEAGAVQCGFCIPGLVLVTKALLDERPGASDEEILAALAGNVCRCTGYVKILDAVRIAAGRLDTRRAVEGRS